MIELLVVIAIIAMLVSILLPSLQRAREAARSLKCATNVNAIAKAARLYATDNDGYLPRDYYGGANREGSGNYQHYFFASRLCEYVGGTKIPTYYDDPEYGRPGDLETMTFDEAQEYMAEIFETMEVYHCPNLSIDQHKLHYISNGLDYEQYRDGLEEGRQVWNSSAASRIEDLRFNPSEAVYIGEANLEKLSTAWYGKHDMFNWRHFPFGTDEKMNTGSRMIRADDMRHFGKTTVVFFDGHAESRELTVEELGLQHFNPLWTGY